MMGFEQAMTLFRQGKSTPRDYLETKVALIQERDASLHAFTCLDLTLARQQADAATERYRRNAPLSAIDGLPIGIKDIIDTSAMPTCMGSEIYQGWRPKADAAAVASLRDAGAVIIGKTHTTEFAIGRSSPTVNPHDPQRSPGGSSSGTAAAIGAGMIAAGLGTQTQGSIIRPASYCGVFGFKPTWGVLPLAGVHPVSHSHDHLGLMAESLSLTWDLFNTISGNIPTTLGKCIGADHSLEKSGLGKPKIAILRTAGYGELEEQALNTFNAHIALWRSKGFTVVEPDDDAELRKFCTALDAVPAISATMVARDMLWPYSQYCNVFPAQISQRIHNMTATGGTITLEAYEDLLSSKRVLKGIFERLAKRHDIFALPSSSGVAPKGLENTGSRTLQVYGTFMGVPSVSLPLMKMGDLPFGIQLMAPAFHDYRLMCHAHRLLH